VTKDDLIEAMAMAMMQSEGRRFTELAADAVPGVVAFVGAWITEQRDWLRKPTDGVVLLALADVWREEMGTDAKESP
jgi:hypothetical protein